VIAPVSTHPGWGTWTGVALDEGVRTLHAVVDETWWFARSTYLCSGAEAALPGWRFVPATGSAPVPTLGNHRCAVLGFVEDAALRELARRHGLTVAMPATELRNRVGDKTTLPGRAAAAGVRVARSVVRRGATPADADPLWAELDAPAAVIQLADNDTSGAGTALVRDAGELRRRLLAWSGRDTKLAEYVDGVPLTVSGVVLPGSVAVGGISYQLVGLNRLTPLWGAHCGNQLLADSQVPRNAAASCRDTCRRLGEQLAREGFLGMFGLDLLATRDGVVVLEINPRIQSVSSLLNAVEIAAGLLPAPAAHLLGFLALRDEARPAVVEVTVPVPDGVGGAPCGQLVMYSQVSGTLDAAPDEGRYRIAGADGGRCVRIGERVPLGALAIDEALVWPFARRGASVARADKLWVVQTPEPVLDFSGGRLSDRAETWLAALDATTRIGG
jgi:ATP-grasp domain